MRDLELSFLFKDEDGYDKATRLILVDQAFSLLYQIESEIRAELKYKKKPAYKNLVEDIQNMICNSGLMEFYN